MNDSAVPFWLALFVVVGVAYGAWRFWPGQEYGSISEPITDHAEPVAPALAGPPLTDFRLTNQDGEEFDSRQMAGEVWVASFFFTNCPSSCLRLNQALAGLQQEPRFDEAKFLSITCDPDNDTPAVLKEYARRFPADHDRWTFCTGPLGYVQRLGQGTFKLTVERQTHSDRAVIVDRQGEVRGRFILTDPAQLEMLRTVLAQCLREPKSPPAETEAAIADSPSPQAEVSLPEAAAP